MRVAEPKTLDYFAVCGLPSNIVYYGSVLRIITHIAEGDIAEYRAYCGDNIAAYYALLRIIARHCGLLRGIRIFVIILLLLELDLILLVRMILPIIEASLKQLTSCAKKSTSCY